MNPGGGACTLHRGPLSIRLYAVALPALLLLTGCVSVRVQAVTKTVLAPDVQDRTLQQLEEQLAVEDARVRGLQLMVNITPTEGGARQGEIKKIPTFSGYMLLRKPSDLHVILQLPYVGSRALDMVSDGKNFKLYIAAGRARAIVGSESMTRPSSNGLENLRPGIIRDALQIPAATSAEKVTLTQDSRILPAPKGQKESIEEPDYELTTLRVVAGDAQVLQPVRVVRISRVTLKPYQMDTYDAEGRVATTVTYNKYQKFGELAYPTDILITRPLDAYTLRIQITKLVLNPNLEDGQFTLDIPASVPIQRM